MTQQSFKHCDHGYTDLQPYEGGGEQLVDGGCIEFSFPGRLYTIDCEMLQIEFSLKEVTDAVS